MVTVSLDFLFLASLPFRLVLNAILFSSHKQLGPLCLPYKVSGIARLPGTQCSGAVGGLFAAAQG